MPPHLNTFKLSFENAIIDDNNRIYDDIYCSANPYKRNNNNFICCAAKFPLLQRKKKIDIVLKTKPKKTPKIGQHMNYIC